MSFVNITPPSLTPDMHRQWGLRVATSASIWTRWYETEKDRDAIASLDASNSVVIKLEKINP